jgi:hypothetical protein
VPLGLGAGLDYLELQQGINRASWMTDGQTHDPYAKAITHVAWSLDGGASRAIRRVSIRIQSRKSDLLSILLLQPECWLVGRLVKLVNSHTC